MCRTKYMYVIFVATYLLKLNVVSPFYLFRNHHNDFYNRFVLQSPSVFHKKYNVIMYLPCTVARLLYNILHSNILKPN